MKRKITHRYVFVTTPVETGHGEAYELQLNGGCCKQYPTETFTIDQARTKAKEEYDVWQDILRTCTYAETN